MINNFLKKLKELLGIKEEKKEYPVIIPDHRKEIIKKESRENTVKKAKMIYRKEKKKEEPKIEVSKSNNKKPNLKKADKDTKIKDLDFDKEVSLFEITGVYSLHGFAFITGFVEVGTLKKSMKAIKNETLIKINEIRKNNEKVAYLNAGEEGTLMIQSKKNTLLRNGDFLEFE
jgi:hypothetical protein